MKSRIILLLALICMSPSMKAQLGPVTLPLGIDVTGIKWNSVKAEDRNYDAKRFLEKTLKEEPDNLNKIRKLLDAGAAAFVTYEMIDNKQYDLMDLMYRYNNKLIRYSQMLHYACAYCHDTAMIDFLVAHGASLDMCGNYYERYHDRGYGEVRRKPHLWNSDGRFSFTPQDVAYRNDNKVIVDHIIRRYGKYPTLVGLADYFYQKLAHDKKTDHLISLLKGEENFYNLLSKGNGYDAKAMSDMLNMDLPTGGETYSYTHILCRAIDRLGVYRENANSEMAAKYEELVRLMMDKGARVDIYDRIVSVFVCPRNNSATFNSPMLSAMKHHKMMDIVKLLRSKGAPKSVYFLNYCELRTKPIEGEPILDEYKEAIFLGDL